MRYPEAKGVALAFLLLTAGGSVSAQASVEPPLLSGPESDRYLVDAAQCRSLARYAAPDHRPGHDAAIGGLAGGVVGALAGGGKGTLLGALLGAGGVNAIEGVSDESHDRGLIRKCMTERGWNG